MKSLSRNLVNVVMSATRKLLAEDVKVSPVVSALTGVSRIERRRALRKKLQEFQWLQAIYMPGLLSIIDSLNAPETNEPECQPEDILLFLPSHSLLKNARSMFGKLPDIEARLREAQAHEFLDELHRQLRTRTFANKYKKKWVTGQRMSIWARKWQENIDIRAAACAKHYRMTCEALLELRGPGEWENTLRVLCDDDIRAINDRALSDREREERRALREAASMPVKGVFGQGLQDGVESEEGRRTISWIWLGDCTSEGDDDDPRVQEGKSHLPMPLCSSLLNLYFVSPAN